MIFRLATIILKTFIKSMLDRNYDLHLFKKYCFQINTCRMISLYVYSHWLSTIPMQDSNDLSMHKVFKDLKNYLIDFDVKVSSSCEKYSADKTQSVFYFKAATGNNELVIVATVLTLACLAFFFFFEVLNLIEQVVSVTVNFCCVESNLQHVKH